MAQKYFGVNIPLASGFDVGAKSPLDSRTVVAQQSDLDTIPDIQRYAGLQVFGHGAHLGGAAAAEAEGLTLFQGFLGQPVALGGGQHGHPPVFPAETGGFDQVAGQFQQFAVIVHPGAPLPGAAWPARCGRCCPTKSVPGCAGGPPAPWQRCRPPPVPRRQRLRRRRPAAGR